MADSDLGHVYRLIDTSYNLRRRKNYKPNENEEEDLDEVLRPVQPTVPTYSSLQVYNKVHIFCGLLRKHELEHFSLKIGIENFFLNYMFLRYKKHQFKLSLNAIFLAI